MPRLVAMGYISPGLEFKYSNRIEMNNEDRIKLYSLITDKYEVAPDEIEKEFGINVGKQLNVMTGMAASGTAASCPTRNTTADTVIPAGYGWQIFCGERSDGPSYAP